MQRKARKRRCELLLDWVPLIEPADRIRRAARELVARAEAGMQIAMLILVHEHEVLFLLFKAKAAGGAVVGGGELELLLRVALPYEPGIEGHEVVHPIVLLQLLDAEHLRGEHEIGVLEVVGDRALSAGAGEGESGGGEEGQGEGESG